MDSNERRLRLGIAAVLLLVFGLWGWQSRKEHQVSAATAKGAAIHDTATSGQAKGEVYDQTVKASEPAVQAAKASVARSKKRLADLPEVPLVPVPMVPGSDSAAVDPELVALRARYLAQCEVVSSQDRYIGELEGKVATLTLSADSWRGTAQARAQELVQANAVIAAQQGLIAGALLKGRLQGLAVGLGSGYAAGSIR